ncbi:hypothetical protein CJP72_19050 [Citrobacter sp. NCU1]|uniref:hypothetical protein n=1 Tax=Citrobacter sp. NCU1 TaxID=2026683 RepID=UPI0013915DEE|nr:hypothetical protein [Citrobacter sp. NCU1]NDO82793.1 hypothetical protein [Citrobacter sp. NCU1]
MKESDKKLFKESVDDEQQIKSSFLDIIQTHVVNIHNKDWQSFVIQAKEGQIVDEQFESSRCNIEVLSRQEFVKNNLSDSFVNELYVKPITRYAEVIGEIDNHPVWFNNDGLYIYWNRETKYLLESWLTFPAYPYHW